MWRDKRSIIIKKNAIKTKKQEKRNQKGIRRMISKIKNKKEIRIIRKDE